MQKEMILIVGLGNKGEKYASTRHNLGFRVVEELAQDLVKGEVKWEEKKNLKSLILKLPSRVLLTKPQTMMNASGIAVLKICQFYKIPPSSVWVIHDDVDLPLGQMKIRMGGAAAGHHGVESIIESLKTDQFLRFRLGIGRPGRGADNLVEKYVLGDFDVNEKTEVKHLLKKAVSAIEVAITEGVEKAMNQFNVK